MRLSFPSRHTCFREGMGQGEIDYVHCDGLACCILLSRYVFGGDRWMRPNFVAGVASTLICNIPHPGGIVPPGHTGRELLLLSIRPVSSIIGFFGGGYGGSCFASGFVFWRAWFFYLFVWHDWRILLGVQKQSCQKNRLKNNGIHKYSFMIACTAINLN